MAWHHHHHHLVMVVARPGAYQCHCGSCYHGGMGSTLSLGHNGGIVVLQGWYGPRHITIVIVMSHHRQGGGPEGAVVGTTRMPSSLSCCGGGMAWGMLSSSQGRGSGSGRVVSTSLHEGDSGHVLVASVILLPHWNRVW